jgi:hypothetical protein
VSSAVRDWSSASPPRLAVLVAVLVALGCCAVVPVARATDKFRARGAAEGQRTAITAKSEGPQSLDILYNGIVSCGGFRFHGAIVGSVVGRVKFTSGEYGSCVYLGSRARMNVSSCEIVIYSGGRQKFIDRGGERCDVRVEGFACTVHLGDGDMLGIGWGNTGSPAEITGRSEPIGIGATAVGVGCPSPGPSAIGQYSGSLLLGGSRGGIARPFKIIL